MASKKWQEPTMGWLSAQADPYASNHAFRVARLKEAVAAHRFMYPDQHKGGKHPLNEEQYLQFISDVRADPAKYEADYKRAITAQAKASATNTLRNGYSGVPSWSNINASQNMQKRFDAMVKQDNLLEQHLKSNQSLWNTIKVNQIKPLSAGFSSDYFQRLASSGLRGNTPSTSYGAFQTPGASGIGRNANSIAQLVSGINFSKYGQTRNNPVYTDLSRLPSDIDPRILEGLIDFVSDRYKTSSNQSYQANLALANALGLKNIEGFDANILNRAMLYDPSGYDNPNLMRYFDAPSVNKRNSGNYTYDDQANLWGGTQYPVEAAKYIFENYSLDPSAFAQRFGQLQGMAATDNPLIHQFNFSNGSPAYFTPYDFALHGVTGTNNTNFLPAKSLEWWLSNATPINLGSDLKLPEFSGSNTFGLKSSTPTIGFLSSINPLSQDEDALKAFQKEFSQYADGGARLSVGPDGLARGSSTIRQSYEKGPGLFEKILSVAAAVAAPFTLGKTLALTSLGSTAGYGLAGAIGGAASAGFAGGDVAKGMLGGGLAGAVGGYASDFAKNSLGFTSTKAQAVANQMGQSLTSNVFNKATAPSISTFAPPSFAPSASMGGGAPTNVASARVATPDAAPQTATPMQSQPTFASNNSQPTNGQPMDYAQRGRRWGGSFGQTLSL